MEDRDGVDEKLSRARDNISEAADDEKTHGNDKKFFSKYNPKNVSATI